ncbi:MAG: queuosine precursor transporter [Sphaerochaetaceae bacterium]
MNRQEQKRLAIFALYITAMVLVNTLGSKITTIAGVRVSVGILFMPILFVTTDVISEVFGHATSKAFVNISTVMLAFMFFMMWLCIQFPPHPSWGMQDGYKAIFGSSMRMTLASVVSFLISQHIDVFTFFLFKKITGGKWFWLRKNLSTIISQFMDTTIFMFIAFYHVNAKYTAPFIFSLIIPYWLFKVVFAIADTPLCYLGVWWLKKGNATDVKAEN